HEFLAAVPRFRRSVERGGTVWPLCARNSLHIDSSCRYTLWNDALKERLKVSFRVIVRSTLFPRGPHGTLAEYVPRTLPLSRWTVAGAHFHGARYERVGTYRKLNKPALGPLGDSLDDIGPCA